MTAKISYKNEVLRKLIHLSSLWMVIAIFILPHNWALLLFGLIFTGMTIYEIGRRYSSYIHKLNTKFLGKILRQGEIEKGSRQLTGAFYVCISAFVGLILFSNPVMMTSMAIMLICDTAAALVGRKIGRHKILDKSLEGSMAFFICASAILYVSPYWGMTIGPWQILTVAFCVTLIELVSSKIKIDDNLTIVFGTILMLYLTGAV